MSIGSFLSDTHSWRPVSPPGGWLTFGYWNLSSCSTKKSWYTFTHASSVHFCSAGGVSSILYMCAPFRESRNGMKARKAHEMTNPSQLGWYHRVLWHSDPLPDLTEGRIAGVCTAVFIIKQTGVEQNFTAREIHIQHAVRRYEARSRRKRAENLLLQSANTK